jgi:CheY-like chemotaxis protein
MTTYEGMKPCQRSDDETTLLRRQVAELEAAIRQCKAQMAGLQGQSVDRSEMSLRPQRTPAAQAIAAQPPAAGKLLVLLADDHPIVRKGLADMLREHPEIGTVIEARDGHEAIKLALAWRPNVIVMDITMPHVSGIEATRQIHAQMPAVRVIGLSMHEEADMARAMLDAGATAYLSKDAPGEALIAAVLGED